MRQLCGAVAMVLFAAVAQAQPYVGASLSADVARSGSSDDFRLPGSGEALSFSLRVGTTVTPRFGVELDFTRPGEIESTEVPDVRILSELGLPGVDALIFPPIIGYEIHTAQRTTTIGTSVWARQEVSPRVSLVYLGGIAFARIDRAVTTDITYRPGLPTIYSLPYETRTVEYTQGPMAGIEARIALTEQAHLVPGIRLLSVAGGWIMRPAVGLSWMF